MKQQEPLVRSIHGKMRATVLVIGMFALTVDCHAQVKPAPDQPPSQRHDLAYVPYDGAGRYAMGRDDGRRAIQGLTELAGRYGVKPYRALLSMPFDGTWQTERVVFHDVDTAATIVRLTNDPWADSLSYFKGNWSSDGQYIVFRRQPGMWEASTATHGPMVVKSDGTGLRNVFRNYPMVRDCVCSPTEPDRCFAMVADKKLVAFDLSTGKAHHVVRDALGGWHLKISPDGKYLMGRCLDPGHRVLWIVSSDGREYHEIAVPESIHDSYQFHPSQKKIMFWYEDRYQTEGFVQCDFDGREMTKVPIQFDWNHGDVGPDRGVHTEGYITRIQGDDWLPKEPLFHQSGVEYYDDPADYNGYLTWMPKNQPWAYATRIPMRPYLSEIQTFPVDPAPSGAVNRCRICYTGLKSGRTLDNPEASPDGTKVLFNSNMLDRVDVYYVVARLPEPPLALTALRTVDGVKLAWSAPAHHAEITGYHVYRSKQSGVGYGPLTREPCASTEFTDRNVPAGATAFYTVSAVEHSGLEGGLSEEAAFGNIGGAKRRIFVEAQQGRCNPKMWIAFQEQASNLHYVWMRASDGKDELVLTVNLPEMDGPCSLWARVQGPAGAEFVAATQGKSLKLTATATSRWTWVKADGTFELRPGKNEVTVSSRLYGSALDCLAISNDPRFIPETSPRIRWPKPAVVQAMKAETTSPYAVQLKWPSADNPAFHHYNLYCGHEPDFPSDQSTVVASPDQNAYCDWGLKPGQTIYYRLTAVDRAGNESTSSTPVKVVLPKLDRVLLERAPSDRVGFEVPRTDLYALWLKIKNGGSGGQYINVKVDNEPAVTWTCAFDGLSDESWFTYDQWGRFPLKAGRHVVAVENKTKNTIESILLTNDLSFRPEGHVNILSGW